MLDAFESVDLEPVVYIDHPTFEVVLGPSPSTNPAHAAALGPTAASGRPARRRSRAGMRWASA